MKKILIFNVLLFIMSVSRGQAPFPNSSEIKQFIASKTCVIFESEPFSPFNMNIKQAMNEYWKITPFEFIGEADFEERRTDPEWSFVFVTETTFDKDKSNASYYFLNLLQGKDVKKLGEMPEICAVPLAFAGGDDVEYGYKLGAILLFIQNHARMISEEPSLTGRRYLTYYNKNVPQVTDKTILVVQEDLSPAINSIEKIRAIYKNRIEIVTGDEIIKAVQDKTPNTVILHKVGPAGNSNAGYTFKMLIGTDDSNMYYYNQHRIDRNNPDGLLPSDLKRLARF